MAQIDELKSTNVDRQMRPRFLCISRNPVERLLCSQLRRCSKSSWFQMAIQILARSPPEKKYSSATRLTSVFAEVADELWQHNRIRLPILPRRNQKGWKHPKPVGRFYNSLRQIIETVNRQPAAQFNIETNHAHTLWGLCARLYTKLLLIHCAYISTVCWAYMTHFRLRT